MGTFINFLNESLTFDAKITEEYTEDTNVTEHPIEGSPTDHSQERPLLLEIEGVISESPFSTQAMDLGEGAVGGRRGLAALQILRRSRGHSLTWVGTRLGVVVDLMITSIQASIPKTASTRFRVSLKQVSFAQTAIVDLPPEFSRAPPTKLCGPQTTSDLTGIANGDTKAASGAFIADELVNGFVTNIATYTATFETELGLKP